MSGDAPGNARLIGHRMMAVLGSVAATRNKLWLYNEQMTLNDKPKPLAKTYAKWVEFTDAMAQQVPSDKNI